MSLTLYFAANDVDNNSKMHAIFLSICGAATYKLIRGLVVPDKSADQSFSQLIDLVKSHCNPKPSKIVQCVKFHCCSHCSGESIATLVAESRQLTEDCNFEASLNDILRDWFICGVNDGRIQWQLLAKDDFILSHASNGVH